MRRRPRGASDPAATARIAAFDVALAVLDGEPDALAALEAILVAGTRNDPGVAVNLLTALQYSLMQNAETRGAWAPPSAAVSTVLRDALGSEGYLVTHAEELVDALIELRLLRRWLGAAGLDELAGLLRDPKLRAQVDQLRSIDRRLSAPVVSGAEFPVAA